jgi:hypothetical protein
VKKTFLFWEANRCWTSQEISRLLWNHNVHHRVHKNPPLYPILNQMNLNSYLRTPIPVLILSFHLHINLVVDTSVCRTVFFWYVTPCSLVDIALLMGDSNLLWNVGQNLPNYTAWHPRRQPFSYYSPREPEISPVFARSVLLNEKEVKDPPT